MRLFLSDLRSYWQYRERRWCLIHSCEHPDDLFLPALSFAEWRLSRWNPRIRAEQRGTKIWRVK